MNQVSLNYDTIFSKGAKISFQKFDSLELKDKDLEELELISSIVLSGTLCKIYFFNVSILSTQFTRVKFEDCDMKSADIGSVWASECLFVNTDFSNATFSDSTFIKCTFDECIFKSINLTRCQFIDCTFNQFLIDDSTFSLNTFTRCHIIKTEFTESFYYQIFEDCIFEKANINPYLLGFNFGISPLNFEGTSTIKITETEAMLKNCGLYINAAIFRINQLHGYYDEALIACVAALGKMIQNDILVKADEIEFLKNLSSYFQERKEIAPISMLHIWQLLNRLIIDASSSIAINKAAPYIREYANTLYFDFIDFQTNMEHAFSQYPDCSNMTDAAELVITYLQKPSIDLLHYLVEFTNLVGKNCPMPVFTHAEKGSYIEFHNIAIAIIPYVQTFFGLLGVIVPFVIYKKQKQDQQPEEQSTKSENITTSEKTEISITLKFSECKPSPILLPNTDSISPKTSTIVADVKRIIETQPQISNNGFGGYNSQNVKAITINFN